MDDIVAEIERAWRSDNLGSHWDGCHLAHRDCAIKILIDEVRKLRKIISEMECG
jgi:hypothetical protein